MSRAISMLGSCQRGQYRSPWSPCRRTAKGFLLSAWLPGAFSFPLSLCLVLMPGKLSLHRVLGDSPASPSRCEKGTVKKGKPPASWGLSGAQRNRGDEQLPVPPGSSDAVADLPESQPSQASSCLSPGGRTMSGKSWWCWSLPPR